jgi:phosphatidylglycerol:prolipoprotein diacylglycerol transferase
MHPILFRIPLPHMPLKLWWALAAIAAVAVVTMLMGLKKGDKGGALTSFVVALSAALGGYFGRGIQLEGASLPIYSYGVMLGLSLVVGWYITLTLTERDGLPTETMANCYVVTAIAAIVGSRVLYIVTNLDEFNTLRDVFAFRRGGLVAYGGFLGGFVGSWFFLSRERIRLMAWADAAVPSLASGLFVTRIGCYLFGCDFGKRLSETAPSFLKKLGTFPHWPQGTLEGGEGSPAFVRHLETLRGTPLASEILKTDASLPVHPTQIYESAFGLLLLALMFWQRKNLRFRGQMFFTFVYAYGFGRFLLEMLRDDAERGEYGPTLSEHLLIPGVLFLFGVAFAIGHSVAIANATARTAARVLAFVPAVLAFLTLRPQSFGQTVSIQLSTSQWIAFLTGALASYYYAQYWKTSIQNPKLAMSLGSGPDTFDDSAAKPHAADDAEDDEPDAA